MDNSFYIGLTLGVLITVVTFISTAPFFYGSYDPESLGYKCHIREPLYNNEYFPEYFEKICTKKADMERLF